MSDKYVVKAETIEVDSGGGIVEEKAKKKWDGVSGEVLHYPLRTRLQNPSVLLDIWKKSSTLPPVVDAYSSSIFGLGFDLVPVVDFKDEELFISKIINFSRRAKAFEDSYGIKIDGDCFLDEKSARSFFEMAKKKADEEKALIELFFDISSGDVPFLKLLNETGKHREIGGNAYWEVVRHNDCPLFIRLLPFQTVRALRLQGDDVFQREEKLQLSPIHFANVTKTASMRKWCQVDNTGYSKVVYFKSFGDPRTISAKTGKVYFDEESLFRKEGHNARLATEIIQFTADEVSGSPYGIPRWVHAASAVLGESLASDYNLNFFNQNTVPTGMLLVAGGKFGTGTKVKIQEFMESNVKGSGNLHKMLLLEASGQSADSRVLTDQRESVPQIKWIPMMQDRQQDAQFLEYQADCRSGVKRQYRVPGLLIGDTEGLNKATAWAVLKFMEENIFQPLREDKDALINNTLLSALGTTFWKFRTKSPDTRDPSVISDMIKRFVDGAVVTTDEARQIANDAVSINLETFGKPWSQVPFKFLEYANNEEEENDMSENETRYNDDNLRGAVDNNGD